MTMMTEPTPGSATVSDPSVAVSDDLLDAVMATVDAGGS